MNIKIVPLGLVICLAPCLGACTPMDPGFGESVRTHMAAQTIDPDPAYNGAEPGESGVKGAAAVERYRTDRVKPPQGIRTTDSNTGSGASAGVSGGQ